MAPLPLTSSNPPSPSHTRGKEQVLCKLLLTKWKHGYQGFNNIYRRLDAFPVLLPQNWGRVVGYQSISWGSGAWEVYQKAEQFQPEWSQTTRTKTLLQYCLYSSGLCLEANQAWVVLPCLLKGWVIWRLWADDEQRPLSRDGTAALEYSPELAEVLGIFLGFCNYCEQPYLWKMQGLKMNSVKREKSITRRASFPFTGGQRLWEGFY